MRRLIVGAFVTSLVLAGACAQPEQVSTERQAVEGGKKEFPDIKEKDFDAVAKKNNLPIMKDGAGNKYVDYTADSKVGKIKMRFTLLPGDKLEVKIMDKPRVVSDDRIFKEVQKQIDEAKKQEEEECAPPDADPAEPFPTALADCVDDDDFIDFIPPPEVWAELTCDVEPCDDGDPAPVEPVDEAPPVPVERVEVLR